jgi:hypothetical protein
MTVGNQQQEAIFNGSMFYLVTPYLWVVWVFSVLLCGDFVMNNQALGI